MSKSFMDCAMRLLTRAHAVEPIRHVSKRQIVDAHGRKAGFTGQKNIFGPPLFIDIRSVRDCPFLDTI